MIIQSSHVFEWGKLFTQQIDLSFSQTILDVGCRQGELTACLAKCYPKQQFLAIDNLETQIQKAKQNQAANLHFQTQNALSLPYVAEFDAIISFNCLLWIENKQQVFHNIFAALRPSGKAYLQFFVRHHYPKNDRFVYQVAQLPKWQTYFQHYQPHYYEISLHECCRLLASSGLAITHLQMKKYPYRITTPQQLLALYESWSSHLYYLPQQRHEQFLNEVIAAYYQAHQIEEDDAFDYHEYLIELVCEKPEQSGAIDPKVSQLTTREAQVLKQYLCGKSAKEISCLLHLSAKTIEYHLAKIKEKLHCHHRSDIFQMAISQGLIKLMFDDYL